jgi:hypothetical protein
MSATARRIDVNDTHLLEVHPIDGKIRFIIVERNENGDIPLAWFECSPRRATTCVIPDIQKAIRYLQQ